MWVLCTLVIRVITANLPNLNHLTDVLIPIVRDVSYDMVVQEMGNLHTYMQWTFSETRSSKKKKYGRR